MIIFLPKRGGVRMVIVITADYIVLILKVFLYQLLSITVKLDLEAFGVWVGSLVYIRCDYVYKSVIGL